jgi:hypothetical protein
LLRNQKQPIMPAPKNNTNARKWTEERVYQYLSEIRKVAADPKELFLGQVLEKLGLYRDILCYWQKKFANNEDLMYEMELVKDNFEVNLVTASLKGQIAAPFAIMCLKANYGWSEDPTAAAPLCTVKTIPLNPLHTKYTVAKAV